ncbi:hypothetical protein LCGC14_2746960, partial [marine sediment metagenome]
MSGRWKNTLNWSDVTPHADYLSRRQVLAGAGAAALGSIAAPSLLQAAAPSQFSTDADPNSWEDITGYNNFYEF